MGGVSKKNPVNSTRAHGLLSTKHSFLKRTIVKADLLISKPIV